METEHDNQKVMAFVASVKQQELYRDADGYVMFTTDAIASEIEHRGRSVDDFLGLGGELPTDRHYPAFMTWEGSVRFTEDDYYTDGKWRRSTGAEVIAVAQGRDPFNPKHPLEDVPVVS